MHPEIAATIEALVEQNVEMHAALTEAKAKGRPFADCATCLYVEGQAGSVCRRCISSQLEGDELDAALAALPPKVFD